MRRHLITLVVACMAADSAFAQGYAANEVNPKISWQTGTTAPTSLNCTAGKDLYANTSTGDLYTCTVTGTPGTWAKLSVDVAKTRVCEVHIWGTGAAGVLQDTDDEAASCLNGFGVTETITAVYCWANAGSPTVTPIVTGGGAILSGALTCGTGSYATGTPSGTPTVAAGGSIDANVTTAGGTATNIRIAVVLTR